MIGIRTPVLTIVSRVPYHIAISLSLDCSCSEHVGQSFILEDDGPASSAYWAIAGLTQ